MRFPRLVVIGIMSLLVAFAGPAGELGAEVEMPGEQFKKLERFEAHQLSQADEAFRKESYRQAAAAYDAFVLEFPRSIAIPYALFRKARSLHRDNQRFAAVKAYTEVLDYFPDAVRYAAAALYYTGHAHWQNGDRTKAMQAWAKMADDAEYSQHWLAADGVNRLADYLGEQGEIERAVKLWRQVAVDFRDSNWREAHSAMEKVIHHHVRREPNEPALRAFYKDVRGFDRRAQEVPDELETILENKQYWSKVRGYIRKHGSFNKLQSDARQAYYRYWADAMAGRFPAWDDYHIDRINFIYGYEEDREQWKDRLDKQFEAHQEPENYQRVIKWIRLFAAHEEKVQEYFQKIKFSEMSNKEIRDLIFVFWDDVKNQEMAEATFEKLRFSEMDDGFRQSQLFNPLRRRSVELAERVCRTFDDAIEGQRLLLELYYQHKLVGKGVAVAEELVNHPDHAQRAWWIKGELHHHARQYDQAILAFRNADNPPKNIFKVAESYAAWGKLQQAVASLREIENFFHERDKFGDAAPRAALEIAKLYGRAGIEDKQIAALRGVIKKYPKSSQASPAHVQLQRLGVTDTGGGVDAE